jgi:large conductance mechanosensitive channel
MKKLLQEFKTFAMRGNVIDMAVGIILGGAFGKIVSSLVGDMIMPLVGLLVGGVNFTDLKITLKSAVTDAAGQVAPAVTVNYGTFLQTIMDFTLIAFCIFMMLKGINRLKHLREKEQADTTPPPPPSEEVTLLTEIRDLLKKTRE